MHDGARRLDLVRGVHAGAHLIEDLPHDAEGRHLAARAMLREPTLERRSRCELGHEITRVGVRAAIEDGDDRRMLDARERDRFVLEPRDDLGVLRQLRAQEFHRDLFAAEGVVLGDEDLSERTFAQPTKELEAPPDHGADFDPLAIGHPASNIDEVAGHQVPRRRLDNR